jgi:hypothetical protein
MIISTQKEIRQLKPLSELLNFRFSNAITGAASFDANGNPEYLFSNGTPVSGGKVFLIKIVQQDAVSKDIFGNSMLAYTPHIFQIAYEVGSAFGLADMATLMLEVGKLGYKVEVYAQPTGAIPSDASIITANQVASLEYDLLFPTKGN